MLTRVDSALKDGLARALAPHAIVIGAGLGGLSAAMRLGARGYRVTVLDRLDSPGGRGSCLWRDGHRFDLGPTIITMPQLMQELWATCGRRFEDDVTLKPLTPFYEIRWPDGSRFEASQDDVAMRDQVAQLNPDDLKGYAKFLRDSQKRYEFGFEQLGRKPMNKLWDLIKVLPIFGMLRADKSVYAHAARRVKDERLRMALSFHPLFIGGDPFNVTSIYTLVSYLEKEHGVHYAMGGVDAIARAMSDVVSDQGGYVRQGAEVDEILIKDDRAAGVRLTGGEVMHGDVIVSNADAGHTYTTLLRNHPRRRWKDRKLKKARWSMSLFVWYFGTKGTRGKWKDVGHHTILNGPRYKELVADIFLKGKLADDMSLYVHRPTVTDPSAAPDGDDTFYALSPVPHLGHDSPVDWAEMAETYRQKVQAMLEEQLLPGLGQHLSASEVFTPQTFQERYLSPNGSGFSIEPRIFQSAWFRPHNVSEEIKGLYLVGAGTHPGAGVPGVISSAEVLDQLVPDPETVVTQ